MKDKNVAGVLALFLGWAGVHRFYLGQVGLGILYVLLIGTGISFLLGLIDAVAFFVMDSENFDDKYNRKKNRRRRRRRYDDRDYDREDRRRDYRDHRERRRDDWRARRARREAERRQEAPRRRPSARKANPEKKKGIEQYKEYDYKGAIESFQKALEVNEEDIAVHFNIACAYSLTEQSEEAFYHLDRAVALGFKDFDKIEQHDAFAFLRIQPDFEEFRENEYRLPSAAPQIEAPKEDDLLQNQPDLLDQIKKLGELREKGLLTEEEFMEQKRKLLS